VRRIAVGVQETDRDRFHAVIYQRLRRTADPVEVEPDDELCSRIVARSLPSRTTSVNVPPMSRRKATMMVGLILISKLTGVADANPDITKRVVANSVANGGLRRSTTLEPRKRRQAGTLLGVHVGGGAAVAADRYPSRPIKLACVPAQDAGRRYRIQGRACFPGYSCPPGSIL
jgi:hypothetical protein